MKNSVAAIVFGLGLVLVFVAHNSGAQNPIIDSYKVSGGGGSSTGAIYTVTGTIGQPDAGTMSAGSYSLTGGFWSVIEAVPTTGGPTLLISYSGNNVLIQWQSQSGWVLQENSDLGNPGGWTNSFGLVTVNGTSFHNVSNPNGALFFRLKH